MVNVTFNRRIALRSGQPEAPGVVGCVGSPRFAVTFALTLRGWMVCTHYPRPRRGRLYKSYGG